jgi:hypothetical protein
MFAAIYDYAASTIFTITMPPFYDTPPRRDDFLRAYDFCRRFIAAIAYTSRHTPKDDGERAHYRFAIY